jgi:murein L,D-transpeptidase YafK
MKRKSIYIFLSLVTLSVISGYFLFNAYGKYLPSSSNDINVPTTLTETQIQEIRSNTPIDEVKVYKSQRYLTLKHKNETIRTYPMRLGFTPEGHKVQEGDGKTPEGRYIIDWRNPKSAFYKSLHISYPNEKDKQTAKNLGVSPGGDIMIHGSATKQKSEKFPKLMNYLPQNDWTWGCIAVRNIDMDEIWKLVDDGTVIEIHP